MNILKNNFYSAIVSMLLIFSFSCTRPGKISIDEITGNDFPAFSRIHDERPPADVIDLNGKWKFRATDEKDWMDAEVPGTVQQDLIRAGRMEDPYYRDNEFDAQWVEKKEWEYSRDFNVDRSFLKKDRIILDCRGLDDICELYLNDSLIAYTQNMFIEYEFDVKKNLKEGKNTLRAVFSPVLEWNRKQADADPRVTWHKGKDATGDGTKGLLFYSRKEASDFGWDWGIRLVSCGIWRPVRIAGYDKSRITDLRVDQDLSDSKTAVLDISAETENYSETTMYLKIDVSLSDKTVGGVTLPVRGNKASGPVVIPNPELWWPNGWGEHPLYIVRAELYDNSGTIDTKQFRIGLRKIEISEEPDDRGQSFGIKVNGRLIFCKGANWMPADALPGRLTESKYVELLSACKESNMNMIRLWGGGLYEPAIFYDYCDENGIMIWHDFMFASGPYLAVDSYLENVGAEIKNVDRRLRHHPSIALWCGNNESEINMVGGQDWLKKYPGVTWEDFDRIFYDLIPKTAALYDPQRPYYPSSPHNPLDRAKSTPEWQTSSGTVHTYEVWGGEKRFDAFSQMGKYRFVAEFGFQSLPHIETVNYFTAPGDRYFPSTIMDHHNLTGKKPNQNQGNVRIATFTADMFRMPSGIRNWVTVSQILQGEGMRMGCEALRRNYPNSTGAMYWQLNDNWPVISWSSIDYFGRWKAVQYMAKRFFSPILVSGIVKEDSVIIYSSNDCLDEKKCRLEWNLSQFDGKVLKNGSKEVSLPSNISSVTERIGLGDLVREDSTLGTYRKDSYRKRGNLFFSFRLIEGDSVLSSNTLFFVPPKYWDLNEPGLNFRKSVVNGKIKIDITAESFAPYVELGVTGSYAHFSDNYFHLAPGEKKTVYISSSELSGEETIKRLFARSLIDTYMGY
jgi:beta-mannosidase